MTSFKRSCFLLAASSVLLLAGGSDAGRLPAGQWSLFDRLDWWQAYAVTYGNPNRQGQPTPGEWTIRIMWYDGADWTTLQTGTGHEFQFGGITGSWHILQLRHVYYDPDSGGYVAAIFNVPPTAEHDPVTNFTWTGSQQFYSPDRYVRAWVAVNGEIKQELYLSPGETGTLEWSLLVDSNDQLSVGCDTYLPNGDSMAWDARYEITFPASDFIPDELPAVPPNAQPNPTYPNPTAPPPEPNPNNIPANRWTNAPTIAPSQPPTLNINSNTWTIATGPQTGTVQVTFPGFPGLAIQTPDGLTWTDIPQPRTPYQISMGRWGTLELPVPSNFSANWVREFLAWCVRVAALVAIVKR